MKPVYKVLLYYKYIKIKNPENLRLAQRQLCEKLNIKGRIIVSQEGINGTVAGLPEAIDSYIHETERRKPFKGMGWKISSANEQVFPKLKVVVRDEIVTLGLKKKSKDVPISKKAEYIEPAELLKLYENNQDFIIIDARNLYEAKIGKFKNALIAPIDNFRDFPSFAKKLNKYKERDVVTYCTGGIRCEKASAYLRTNGFKKVRQLHGGIHVYSEKVGGKNFEGEMFVFDKRLHVPVNSVNPTIISSCIYCQTPITRYIDCTILSCHSLFICCPDCQKKNLGTCSQKCKDQLSSQKSKTDTKPEQSAQFL